MGITKGYGLLRKWQKGYPLFISFILIKLFLFFGCSQKPKERVLARVNGEKIMAEDFIEFYNTRPRIADWTSQDGRLDPNQVLNAIIDKVLMAQKGNKMKLDRFPEFKDEMRKFEEKALVNIFISKWFDPKVYIKDEDVEKAIPDYQKKEVRFGRICVLTEKEAWEIKRDLDQGGDFASLARERSIGLEAQNSGVGDFISPHRGIYPKDTIKLIFELPIGEVSTPQKIREGYALFKPIMERHLNTNEKEQLFQYKKSLMFREEKNRMIRDLLQKAKKERDILINHEAIEDIAHSESPDSESPDVVLAEGKDLLIRWADLKELEKNLIQGRTAIWKDPNMLLKVLSSRIDQRLIVLEAKKAGVHKDADLKKQISKFRQDLLVRQLMMNEIERQLSVSEEECQIYYKGHDDQFFEPEMIRASHILIQDKQNAEEIISKLKQGADFGEIASKYSEYKASSKRAGDMGYIRPGETGMGDTFEQAAFSLKKGEISGLLKTPIGYQIITITDKRPARTLPFEEVKDKIREDLINKKRQNLFETYLKDLRSKVNIKIDQALFNELKEDLA